MDGVFSKLKNLDAYPKVNEDFFTRTFSGGVITIVSSIVMFCLFISEFGKLSTDMLHKAIFCCRLTWLGLSVALYLRMTTISELSVDTSRGELMDINVGLLLHPCAVELLALQGIMLN